MPIDRMLRAGKPIRPRPAHKWPPLVEVPPKERENPTAKTVLKLIWNTVVWIFHDPLAMLLGSSFVVLMLWGLHGRLDLVRSVWGGWAPFSCCPDVRPRIIPGIPWDHEWLAFWAGALLLAGIPALLIKLVFKQDLSEYGLGGPQEGRWRLTLLAAGMLFVTSLPAFYLGARDPEMQATYPLYRGKFAGNGEILLYELGYFPFFLAIEFIFRGYLLFGVYRVWRRRSEAVKGAAPRGFGYYAILISMLSYTAWHLGKPQSELWGTLAWGVATGSIALATGTIWPIILIHWLLNVFLDFTIWRMSSPA